MTDIPRILRMRGQEIEDVVKQIIQREQSDDDRRYREEYRNKIHEGSFLGGLYTTGD
jgi:cytidylate kinase